MTSATESGIDRVWYASYGSNLLAERFGYYLSGGAMPLGDGSSQSGHHVGARDSTPASADMLWTVPHQLGFGGNSAQWGGGGVAHIDPEVGTGEAHVRMWQVTPDQFDDIAAQENGLAPGSLSVDHAAAVAHGHLDVSERWYGRVMYCGHVEGHPVLTFTGATLRAPSAPGPAYLRVVGRGLLESGVTIDNAVRYLLDAPGVGDVWSAGDIGELVMQR